MTNNYYFTTCYQTEEGGHKFIQISLTKKQYDDLCQQFEQSNATNETSEIGKLTRETRKTFFSSGDAWFSVTHFEHKY